MKKIKWFSLLLTGVCGLSAVSCGKNDASGSMRDISTAQVVKEMGVGWNLGNTLEACGDWISGSSVENYETAWGNPVTKKEMIDGIADAGFRSVRIPVAWSNMMAADYTIDSSLIARVKEVTDYVLDNDMYAIINIHWDGGWISKADEDHDGTMEKYKAIWNQVAGEFSGYSDKLIFESLNEEGVYENTWNRYSNTGDKEKAFGLLNELNQTFVDLVRGSGGNNEKRHLLIAGYATDVDLTCDPAFKMPADPQNRCAVSVHYYTPSTFAILTEDADWGQARSTWGSPKEQNELNGYMDKLKTTFVDQGVPVIIGEFGTTTTNKDPESVRLYLRSVAQAAYERGMCPVLWDNGEHYDRSTCKFRDEAMLQGLQTVMQSQRD